MTDTAQGRALFEIVPAIYRTRDTGDLRKYFEAAGTLLDQLQCTLEQKAADNFPDRPLDGSLAGQEWLLPYFADLLSVRLVSPLVEGKREEISMAVRWRQGKGTVKVVEEVAEAIGQLEVVVHEGWQRVATTARIGMPFPSSTVSGYLEDIPDAPPRIAARHPALPAVTLDFSCPSGAVAASSGNAGVEQSSVDGVTAVWRQASQHGVPCNVGGFDDVSRRTVDFRCPDWRRGHYHPGRVLLFMVSPAGFFPPGMPSVNWSDPPSANFLDLIDVIEEAGTTTYRNKTFATPDFRPVRIRRVIRLGQEPDGVGDADAHTWIFQGLVLDNTLEADSGRVRLEQCAGRRVQVHSIDEEAPVITARGCLFKNLQAARGLSLLEYCTVLETTLSERVLASDCIFTGNIQEDHPDADPPERGCLRYSAILPGQDPGGMKNHALARQLPVFFNDTFGERGCGVLHPATVEGIRHGAEDGGEMGAYHDLYLSLLSEAVVDKLADYLPLGLEAVSIPDAHMLDLAEL